MSTPSPAWWSTAASKVRGYFGVVALIVAGLIWVLAETNDFRKQVLVISALGAVAALAMILALFFALVREKPRAQR